jgi:hypothetical protein
MFCSTIRIMVLIISANIWFSFPVLSGMWSLWLVQIRENMERAMLSTTMKQVRIFDEFIWSGEPRCNIPRPLYSNIQSIGAFEVFSAPIHAREHRKWSATPTRRSAPISFPKLQLTRRDNLLCSPLLQWCLASHTARWGAWFPMLGILQASRPSAWSNGPGDV